MSLTSMGSQVRGSTFRRHTGASILGSPARVLSVKPPFTHYHFVEKDAQRAKKLRQLGDPSVLTVYEGDCNEVLLKEVFPKCRYEDFRRALVPAGPI